jgi:flagellar protein FlbD
LTSALSFGPPLPTEGPVIIVTRLHGTSVAVNCDLIERVEATPDTVLTLVDGSRYVVRESVAEVVDKVRAFRASVVVLAGRPDAPPATGHHLHLVPSPDPDG